MFLVSYNKIRISKQEVIIHFSKYGSSRFVHLVTVEDAKRVDKTRGRSAQTKQKLILTNITFVYHVSNLINQSGVDSDPLDFQYSANSTNAPLTTTSTITHLTV